MSGHIGEEAEFLLYDNVNVNLLVLLREMFYSYFLFFFQLSEGRMYDACASGPFVRMMVMIQTNYVHTLEQCIPHLCSSWDVNNAR